VYLGIGVGAGRGKAAQIALEGLQRLDDSRQGQRGWRSSVIRINSKNGSPAEHEKSGWAKHNEKLKGRWEGLYITTQGDAQRTKSAKPQVDKLN
jgi:hypothetical protein